MVRLQGRILFLTEDPELIKRQLAGEDLPWDTAASRAQSQAARRHLHRRDHPGAHLLLLRRDAGRVSLHRPEVRQRDAHQARRREARRLRVRGQRQAARQGIQPRAVALCRDVGRHQAGDRGEHRAHLQAELPEPRRADLDRLRPDRQDPPRRRDSAGRVHRRRRRDHAPGDRVRRPVPVQRGAPAGQSLSAAHQDQAAAHDHRGEDFRAAHAARHQPGRRRSGKARRHRIRAHRSALQPRIRHADGGDFLRALPGQGRAGHRRRHHHVLPRPPHVSG